MTLKAIHRLQAFSNAIRQTFMQHFTRFQLTACSHGSSALAELLAWHSGTLVWAPECPNVPAFLAWTIFLSVFCRFTKINNALCAAYLGRFLCYWRRNTPMTLKSGFRVGKGHWKLHQWIPCVLFLLVINCTRGRIAYRLWDIASDRSKIALFATSLAFNTPDGGFLWRSL